MQLKATASRSLSCTGHPCVFTIPLLARGSYGLLYGQRDIKSSAKVTGVCGHISFCLGCCTCSVTILSRPHDSQWISQGVSALIVRFVFFRLFEVTIVISTTWPRFTRYPVTCSPRCPGRQPRRLKTQDHPARKHFTH